MSNLILGRGIFDHEIFSSANANVVELIEGPVQGVMRRRLVTEELVSTHIENDFGDSLTTLKTPSDSRSSLRFFYSVRKGAYTGELVRIPLVRDLFRRIAPYARISKIWPDIVHRKTAMHVFTTPQTPPWPPHSTKPSENRHLSFILQSIPGAVRGVCASMSFTHDFSTGHAYVFMHGLEDGTYREFVRHIEDGAARATPFLIPSLLIQFSLEYRLMRLNGTHDEIYDYEMRIGIRHDDGSSAPSANPSIDYSGLAKDLNAATMNLAYMAWACQTTTRQLAFLDQVAERYRSEAVRNGMDETKADGVRRMLMENQDHLRCWNESIEERVEYLAKRGQALVQTVYSGIAQRDAALSHITAVSTARDGAVMRVIAAITMFFLPATTTATFFSTSFFDFKVGPHQSVYSWWLWLYWVVTIVLTVLVFLGAVAWWKRNESSMWRRQESETVRKTLIEIAMNTEQAATSQSEDEAAKKFRPSSMTRAYSLM